MSRDAGVEHTAQSSIFGREERTQGPRPSTAPTAAAQAIGSSRLRRRGQGVPGQSRRADAQEGSGPEGPCGPILDRQGAAGGRHYWRGGRKHGESGSGRGLSGSRRTIWPRAEEGKSERGSLGWQLAAGGAGGRTVEESADRWGPPPRGLPTEHLCTRQRAGPKKEQRQLPSSPLGSRGDRCLDRGRRADEPGIGRRRDCDRLGTQDTKIRIRLNSRRKSWCRRARHAGSGTRH